MITLPYSQAMRDPQLVGNAYDGPSWDAWRVIHARLDGEPPPADIVPHWAPIWAELGGGSPWLNISPDEWHLIAARRTSKSRELGRRNAWFGVTFDPSRLSPGELAVIGLYGGDRQQASIMLSYASGFLHGSPLLERMIEAENSEEIRLTNRVIIRIMTASFRTGARGPTLLAAGCDESGFWYDDGANPDRFVFGAIRPALATLRGQLGSISSPWRQSGELHRVWKRYFGQANERFLVLKGPWHVLNPTLDRRVIDDAMEDDPERARSEWYAEWAQDVATYASRDLIEAAVIEGRGDLPRSKYSHFGFFDASSGEGKDSTAWAAAHAENGRGILDCVGEAKPPFNPEVVAAQAAQVFRSYGVTRIVKDHWAKGWVDTALAKHGVRCEQSSMTKSDIYLSLLPLLTARRVELPDDKKLIAQLCALERRVARGGRESVDHPSRGFGDAAHDDLANAAAGALVLAMKPRSTRSESHIVWG